MSDREDLGAATPPASASVAQDDRRLEIEALRAEVAHLREGIKEREISFLRALRTLFGDLNAHRRGERDFPQAALLGAVFAYLRPRVWFAVGGIGALILGLTQIWILVNQNRLLERQIEADRAQAVAAAISGLDPRDSITTAISLAQLSGLDSLGVEILIRIVEGGQPTLLEPTVRHLARSDYPSAALKGRAHAAMLDRANEAADELLMVGDLRRRLELGTEVSSFQQQLMSQRGLVDLVTDTLQQVELWEEVGDPLVNRYRLLLRHAADMLDPDLLAWVVHNRMEALLGVVARGRVMLGGDMEELGVEIPVRVGLATLWAHYYMTQLGLACPSLGDRINTMTADTIRLRTAIEEECGGT